MLKCLACVAEMLSGWWRVTDIDELRSIEKACHSRGIRERALQKQLQKHMDHISQLCAKNRHGKSWSLYASLCRWCLKCTHAVRLFSYCHRCLWAGEASDLRGHSLQLVCRWTGHGRGHRCPAAGRGARTQSHVCQPAGQGIVFRIHFLNLTRRHKSKMMNVCVALAVVLKFSWTSSCQASTKTSKEQKWVVFYM